MTGVRSTKEAIAWVETTFHVSYTESGMRKLLLRLDYRYKKPAPVPANANPEAQQSWLAEYGEKSLLTAHGRVYFIDAAHLLHNAVPSHGWIKRNRRVELPTNSGRNRLNVLGAYSPDDHSLIAIEDTASCDAEMVCRLLHKLRAAHAGSSADAGAGQCALSTGKACTGTGRELQITLLFLPPYSPNLNLIERFWKFLSKHTMRNRFYPTFAAFRAAIQQIIFHLDDYTDELTSLMTEHFQLFGQRS